MIDPSLFALFLIAALIIYLTPGPDMLYVLAHALSMGAWAGIVASLGRRRSRRGLIRAGQPRR